jgi:hypothetical protein
MVHITDKGYAAGDFKVTKTLEFTSFSPASGSFAGGQTVTLTGKGLTSTGKVEICGANCEFVSGDNDTYLCKTTPLLTDVSLADDLETHVDSGNGSFSYSTTVDYIIPAGSTHHGDHSKDKAFDGDLNTYFQAEDAKKQDCYIGVDAGANYKIKLEAVEFYPNQANHSDVTNAIGATIEGSDDNSTWTNILTFDRILNGWNRTLFRSDQNHMYRYYRLKNDPDTESSCVVAEIKFEGPRIH